MGKDDKEDSGFGFKDRAKAEETLKLLEQHDPNYRRLTVRGLLGRAKRVLSLTKAEEKIKNIKEAMEVFETWLAELEGNKQKSSAGEKKQTEEKRQEKRKSSDKDSEDEEESLPSESVPGLGFKDPEAAQGSLKALEGRDPDYQLLAVKGLLRSAKRVLTCTKDETKLSNIKEAMSILETFVDEFESQHRSRQNCPYLPLGVVRTAETLAGADVTDEQKAFITAYASVRGEYKRLRNVGEEGHTWDVRRNAALKELKEKYSEAKLFTSNDEPTPEHLQYLLWAYSPEADKVKKVIKPTDIPDIDNLKLDRKRKSSGGGESDSKKKKE